MRKSLHQKILMNDQGSMSLQYLCLFSLLLLISFYNVAKNLESLRKIKERKNNYLCVKILLANFEKYNQEMSVSNQIIFLNYFLQFNPKTGPVHTKIIEATKLYQEITSLNYYRKILQEKKCSSINRLSFAKNILYKRKLPHLLARDQFERAQTNKLTDWSYTWESQSSKRLLRSSQDQDHIKVTFIEAKNQTSPYRYKLQRISLSLLEENL